MVKKIIIVMMILLSILASACGADKKKNYPMSRFSPDDQLMKVRLILSPEEITEKTDKICVSVLNDSNQSLICGEFSYLEIQVDGVWREYPLLENIQWYMTAYDCQTGEIIEIPGAIQGLYGNLTAGHYRVIKDFMRESDASVTEGYAAVEFDVVK